MILMASCAGAFLIIARDLTVKLLDNWWFTVISGLPYFYRKISGYVAIYRRKDRNTAQGNLAELVGSPVAPFGCK